MSYTQNWKIGNIGKCSLTSDFDSCNLIFKNDKNELRQNFKIIKWIKKKKKKTFKVSDFSILPYTQHQKIGNLGKFYLFQIFTVVVTFSKFAFSRERMKPCFFVTFNIKSSLSWKFHWSSWSCSEDMESFSFNITIFINFSSFLTFLCYKEINDVSI